MHLRVSLPCSGQLLFGGTIQPSPRTWLLSRMSLPLPQTIGVQRLASHYAPRPTPPPAKMIGGMTQF